MYLQTEISRKTPGSISQRHGSADPDPYLPKCHGSATLLGCMHTNMRSWGALPPLTPCFDNFLAKEFGDNLLLLSTITVPCYLLLR
jgi:hypothetical protein